MNPTERSTMPGAHHASRLTDHGSRITDHGSRITHHAFTHTAATLLLALSTALFIINLSGPPHLVLPRDPISGLSFRYLFWIFAVVAALLGFLCLFSDRPARLIPWVAWLAFNFLVYRVGLYFDGCHSLAGFLACATYAFALPPKAASLLLDLSFAYLWIGSCITLLFRWLRPSKSPLIQQSSNPAIHDASPAPLHPSVR